MGSRPEDRQNDPGVRGGRVMPVDPIRLEQANAIIATFAPYATLSWDRGIWVSWTDWRGNPIKRKWKPISAGSDYPCWKRDWGLGGTCTQALAHCIRWAKSEPVFPLGCWEYWCGPSVGLCHGKQPNAATVAASFDWPLQVPCGYCGKMVGNGVNWDWYDYAGYRGPACNPGCEAWRKLSAEWREKPKRKRKAVR